MTTENTDENPPEVPATCTLLLAPHDSLDRILVVRTLDGFATHWMDHYGAWVALPDTPDGMQDLMVQLDADPTLLPQLDLSYVDVSEPDGEDQYDQVPFGD